MLIHIASDAHFGTEKPLLAEKKITTEETTMEVTEITSQQLQLATSPYRTVDICNSFDSQILPLP